MAGAAAPPPSLLQKVQAGAFTPAEKRDGDARVIPYVVGTPRAKARSTQYGEGHWVLDKCATARANNVDMLVMRISQPLGGAGDKVQKPFYLR
eukprot:gene25664-49784_t